jgi:hypothetical protein
MEGRTDFYVAAVGAAAAPRGLLVVAISINIAKIMTFPMLPGRAAQTIITLGAALVIASLGLFPRQASWVFGLGLRKFGDALRQRKHGDPLAWTLLPVAMDAVTVAPTIVGGALLVAGNAAGPYWIGAGIVLSFVSALENGWVLLVEILR